MTGSHRDPPARTSPPLPQHPRSQGRPCGSPRDSPTPPPRSPARPGGWMLAAKGTVLRRISLFGCTKGCVTGAVRALVFAGQPLGPVAVRVPASPAPGVRLLVRPGVLGASAAHSALPVLPGIAVGREKRPPEHTASNSLVLVPSLVKLGFHRAAQGEMQGHTRPLRARCGILIS